MFGISGAEFLVVAVVATMVLGPKNVTQVIHALKKAVEALRAWSAKLREESAGVANVGISKEDLEKFKGFDMRQFDPRAIVRDAVQEEMKAWIAAAEKTSADISPMAPAVREAPASSTAGAAGTSGVRAQGDAGTPLNSTETTGTSGATTEGEQA